MKLTQCEVILKAMLENKSKDKWSAKDFQSGKYFVGYEASARMSDLIRMYPELFIRDILIFSCSRKPTPPKFT